MLNRLKNLFLIFLIKDIQHFKLKKATIYITLHNTTDIKRMFVSPKPQLNTAVLFQPDASPVRTLLAPGFDSHRDKWKCESCCHPNFVWCPDRVAQWPMHKVVVDIDISKLPDVSSKNNLNVKPCPLVRFESALIRSMNPPNQLNSQNNPSGWSQILSTFEDLSKLRKHMLSVSSFWPHTRIVRIFCFWIIITVSAWYMVLRSLVRCTLSEFVQG